MRLTQSLLAAPASLQPSLVGWSLDAGLGGVLHKDPNSLRPSRTSRTNNEGPSNPTMITRSPFRMTRSIEGRYGRHGIRELLKKKYGLVCFTARCDVYGRGRLLRMMRSKMNPFDARRAINIERGVSQVHCSSTDRFSFFSFFLSQPFFSVLFLFSAPLNLPEGSRS